ncbi:MAG: hypothetical protein E7620_01060 [Ruminococcaceae bacterium]|nr:hypothetical protein [Oscillospiraceae bacterium]
MKLGLFSDSHYCKLATSCGTRRPSLSLGKLREAMDAFREEKVDYVLCLGDLTDKGTTPEEPRECMEEILRLIGSYGLPFRAIAGNHDYAVFSGAEFSALTGSPEAPFLLETDTHTLIFLDANFRSDLRRFDVAGVEWKDSNLPHDQLIFLKNALDAATKPCVVLLHENLDPTVQVDHIVKNAAEARAILEASGKVSLVLQGHYHWGADTVINGIRYLTLPAMCEGEDNHFLILEI